MHDTNDPEYDPPDCPAWAKETVPDSIQPFRGRNGLPKPYVDRTGPCGVDVRGIDRYHANQFIVYRPETAQYLYTGYTPLRVNYRRGLLPSFEALSSEVTAGCRTEAEKIVALLTKGAAHVKHPDMPPCGDDVAPDRNADDETLLKSGLGWCNEQARVFVRLCQVNNIPARLIQLFYSDEKTGHCVAELFTDGRWCMADASWFCLCPGPDGKWLSAAQCHDRGVGQKYCGIGYQKRFQELLKMSDRELNFGYRSKPEDFRRHTSALTAEDLANKMNCFGVINYPQPRDR
jgi:hypothetical protein